MTLANLSEAELIGAAGGDPWAINHSLQAGSPFQISRLAEAFHGAGRHSAEADHAFEQARKRFEVAWNHQNGDNPINDSAEVQRVTNALGQQSEQLPKIGADLENVAAALADAQKQGAAEIASLDHRLQVLDKLIGAAKKDLQLNLPEQERNKLLKLIDAAHADAVDDVRDAVKQMDSIRNAYSDTLHKALGSLHTEGYDPPPVMTTPWSVRCGARCETWGRSPVREAFPAFRGSGRRTWARSSRCPDSRESFLRSLGIHSPATRLARVTTIVPWPYR